MIFELAKHFFRTAAFLLAATPQILLAEDVRLFSVGSGDTSGNYYPVARAICDVFNESDTTRRRCSPEPTPGSIYNLELLGEGELEFAIAQSDWLQAAFDGTGPFADTGAKRNLRIVMPLFPEAVTIVTTAASGIESSSDLIGKVIDIGRPASGRNATIRSLLDRLGMDVSVFGGLRELDPGYAIEELCAGRVDAAVFVVGHPSALVQEAVQVCGARIVEFVGPNIERIVAESADYQVNTIATGPYGRPGANVRTIAVVATLVAREDVEDSIVKDLVQAVQSDVGGSIGSNSLLKEVRTGSESSSGFTVPSHSGVTDQQ